MKQTTWIAIVVLVSAIAIARTVEVYKAGPNGRGSWQETTEKRDRSAVPRPSLQDRLSDFKRRSKVPVPSLIQMLKARTNSVPRPSLQDRLADFRRRSKVPAPRQLSLRPRSQIPIPRTSSYRMPSDDIPRPSIQDIEADYRRRSGIPLPGRMNNFDRQTAVRRYYKQKKNLINRILFSLPIGAQFPIYFSSQSPRKGSNKKSGIALPMHGYRMSYGPQTWRRPIGYRSLPGFEPAPRKRYYTQLPDNRNSLSSAQRYQAPKSRYFLNRIIRTSNPTAHLKPAKTKDVEQSRKAMINKALP